LGSTILQSSSTTFQLLFKSYRYSHNKADEIVSKTD